MVTYTNDSGIVDSFTMIYQSNHLIPKLIKPSSGAIIDRSQSINCRWWIPNLKVL